MDWGSPQSVALYLERCQVSTPSSLVQATWRHVRSLRDRIGKVVDFGAGDGRFSQYGSYNEYLGYEVDGRVCKDAPLPPKARLLNQCAFAEDVVDADVCIGNPPFVRNQDLPTGWRERASAVVQRRTGVAISGLANAWQYFFFLSLASVKNDGLCALVIPYEWVSRPSARALRSYISGQRWNVSVYRLVDTTFNSVLTTSSVTIVDKAKREGRWLYFEESADGSFRELPSPTGDAAGIIPYRSRAESARDVPFAQRGLSPGTQKALTLTEGERVRLGLRIDRDVVPCVTSLRELPSGVTELSEQSFAKYFRHTGQRCWLIRTDKEPGAALAAYIDSVLPETYQTKTCIKRAEWWRFRMPPVPRVLVSMSFKGAFPKAVRNVVGARAVGGVYGVFQTTEVQEQVIASGLGGVDIRDRVVAHANGLKKIEVNQLNSLLFDAFRNSTVSH
jgi:hypothetical protein